MVTLSHLVQVSELGGLTFMSQMKPELQELKQQSEVIEQVCCNQAFHPGVSVPNAVSAPQLIRSSSLRSPRCHRVYQPHSRAGLPAQAQLASTKQMRHFLV